MNTYDDNLQTAIRTTLNQLSAEEQKLASDAVCAQFKLYYAQSAEITAQERMNAATIAYDETYAIQQQGVANINGINNVRNTATLLQKNTATLATNAATAASNIQVATNAVTKLASDVGSALNIVTAADYGTDIYYMTSHVNTLIQKTAYHAEYTSQKAMDASADSAEITAADLLSEAESSKADLETLTQAIDAELQKASTGKEADTQTFVKAKQSENRAEGALKDIDQESTAIQHAFHHSNNQLNFDLTVVASNATQMTVSFNKFSQPFAKDDLSGIDIPDPDPTYYIALVPEPKKEQFKLAQAESSFTLHKEGSFFPIKPTKSKPLIQQSCNITGKKDVDNKPIQAGVSYVAFLYIELSTAYKKYLNHFVDALSAPSAPLTFTHTLPVARLKQDGRTQDKVSGRVTRLTFDAPMLHSNKTEFRCFFLPARMPSGERLLTDDASNNSDLNLYFNLSIAKQVSAGNYVVAEAKRSTGSSGKENTAASASKAEYQVTLSDDLTDALGNRIIQGQTYIPVFLSAYGGDGTDRAQYTENLSDLTATPINLWPEPDSPDNKPSGPSGDDGGSDTAKKPSSDPSES